MSHRLSQLLGGLQSKLDAAAQSHSNANSYGVPPNGAQAPYGAPNSYNPPAPYGPPSSQGAPAPYGPPGCYAPPGSYGAPGPVPGPYEAPYPSNSPFPEAPPTPQDPPAHTRPSNADDSLGLNLNPHTLEPYGAPANAQPPAGSQNDHAAPYGAPSPHVAPLHYGHPAHAQAPYGVPNQYAPPPPAGSPNPPYGAPAQYAPPPPTGSPNPPYSASNQYVPPQTGSPNPPYVHPSQQPPPGPYAPQNPGSSAHYGAPTSYPQSQPLHAPASGPSSFPTRIAIRSGGLASSSTTMHDARNPSAPPLFSFHTSGSKPQVVMLHADGRTELGEASISSMTMNMELKHRGQSMPMKQSEMGDTFTLESSRGKFKWSVDQMTGGLEKMVDESGKTVAKYKGGEIPGVGERSVEICVPSDEQLFELILLSVMAARALNKKNIKVGIKFFRKAMVGA